MVTWNGILNRLIIDISLIKTIEALAFVVAQLRCSALENIDDPLSKQSYRILMGRTDQ